MLKQLRKQKREFQYHKQIELEADLGCPWKFWRSIKRLNICKSKKNNFLEMFDIKRNDEAVEVWFNHFSKLLGGGSVGEAHPAPELSRHEDDYLDRSEIHL